jgi:hypothetical protein
VTTLSLLTYHLNKEGIFQKIEKKSPALKGESVRSTGTQAEQTQGPLEKKKSSALEGESVRATQAEHTGSSHHTRVQARHTNTHTQYMLPRGCS